MASLASHQSAVTTKMLLLGDSGAGKTGSLASLAQAGYNLRILDLDNGLDVLANLLSDLKSPYGKDAINRVNYITVTDPMKNIAGKLIPVKASVWQRSMGYLQKWDDGEVNYGPITSWTPQEILVIDSLSFLANSALNLVLAMNGRLGQQAHQSDWFQAQNLIKSFLEMLYDESVKCSVIVCAHVAYQEVEGSTTRGLPNTLGKALNPIIGRYFNNTLLVKSVGQGAAIKRKILTNTTGVVELKNSAPLKVLSEYPIETGLAEYFRAVQTQPKEPTK